MKFKSDIDIDFGDRARILSLLAHTPASIMRDGNLVKHNTGVYVTDIPQDPFTGIASIDHKIAEDRGYSKLDFLNVSLYTQIKSEEHLTQLMKEPLWDLLNEREVCEQLIHINGHYDTLVKMPEPVFMSLPLPEIVLETVFVDKANGRVRFHPRRVSRNR